MKRILLCCPLILSLFVSYGQAQEGKKEEKEGRNKLATTTLASAINFSKQLGVPLGCLRSLGADIDQARRLADPVELASLAQKLAIAEKVAGKKASLSAEALMTEAIELAKQREYAAELQAVALMASDAAAQKELTKAATLAQRRDAEMKAAIIEGAKPKALFGTLTVVNHSGECLRIYVSGRYVGEVHAGEQASFHAHDHSHITTLVAICEDGEQVASRNLHGHFHGYYWHIDQ